MATVTLTEYCSTSDLQTKLTQVDTILNNLMTAMTDGSVSFSREGYSFDDGQTKIQTTFKNLKEISDAYQHWLKVRHLICMQLNGGGIYTAREMNIRR